MGSLLIIDDDAAIRRTLELHYQAEGHSVLTASSGEAGLATALREKPELVILDIRMSGQSGLQILPQLKEALPDCQVIMITAFHDMQNTIEAMKLGASDYINKPIDLDELDVVVAKVLCVNESSKGNIEFKGTSGNPVKKHIMSGDSQVMKEVFKVIGRVANSSATVLISGESGTGKELVARAIHNSGPNAEGPFIAVNCAALMDTLLESEMFGHEKGAFTGAVDRHLGKFILANNGTLFLDEIGELSPRMQAKLLRVLQEKECTPLGGRYPVATNARVIGATNKDLYNGVKSNEFREDLFYRLMVVNIHIPPLRERKEDIPGLVEVILARLCRESGRMINQVSMDAMRVLCDYDWPGNVRELENALTKAVALCNTDTLHMDLLPQPADDREQSQSVNQPQSKFGLSLEEAEKAHILRTLELTNWHKGKSCDILGISRPRLRRMMEKYQIKKA